MDQTLANERRSVKRVAGITIVPVELAVSSLGLPVPATVRDISVTGIGLVAARRLEAGTALVIKRRDSRLGPVPPLTAEVRQATRLQDGTWLLGCGFSRLLSTNDIMGLG